MPINLKPRSVNVFEQATIDACNSIHQIQKNFIMNSIKGEEHVEQIAQFIQSIMLQLGLPWEENPK